MGTGGGTPSAAQFERRETGGSIGVARFAPAGTCSGMLRRTPSLGSTSAGAAMVDPPADGHTTDAAGQRLGPESPSHDRLPARPGSA